MGYGPVDTKGGIAMAHYGHHRLAHSPLGHLHLGRWQAAAIARRLKTAAVTLLVAYGIVCLILAFTDNRVPEAVIELGLCALAAAGVGWLAPRLIGLVLVLTGAVIGPATALIAKGIGHDYAASLDDRALASLFTVPFIAGILLLVADRINAHDQAH